jgi:hypothetical protein
MKFNRHWNQLIWHSHSQINNRVTIFGWKPRIQKAITCNSRDENAHTRHNSCIQLVIMNKIRSMTKNRHLAHLRWRCDNMWYTKWLECPLKMDCRLWERRARYLLMVVDPAFKRYKYFIWRVRLRRRSKLRSNWHNHFLFSWALVITGPTQFRYTKWRAALGCVQRPPRGAVTYPQNINSEDDTPRTMEGVLLRKRANR